MEPNKENLRKWVKALRSGEFKQGRGQLRKGDRFCCLGVATEIYRRETGRGRWYTGTFYETVDDWSLLPFRVQQWLGVESGDPNLQGDHATVLNDTQRLSFCEIANRIEKEYEL